MPGRFWYTYIGDCKNIEQKDCVHAVPKKTKRVIVYIFHVFDDSFIKFLIYIDVYIWIKFKDPSVLIIRETQDDLEMIRKDRIESSVCTVFLYCSGFGLGYKSER